MSYSFNCTPCGKAHAGECPPKPEPQNAFNKITIGGITYVADKYCPEGVEIPATIDDEDVLVVSHKAIHAMTKCTHHLEFWGLKRRGTSLALEGTQMTDTITLTLHQVQRLVEGYYDMEDCRTIDDVRRRVSQVTANCDCSECKESPSASVSYLSVTAH